MWLQTNIGFYSIVSKPEDQETGQLTIRARIKSDLLALKNLYLPSLGAITESTKTDYRYRSKVSRTDLAQAMTNMIGTIGYGNFKNEIAAVQGKQRSNLYGRVWSNLYELDLEPEEFDWDSTAAIDRMAVPAADAYGVVLVSPDGRTLLRKPSRGFGGYSWSFAKGQPNKYETPQETARRECLEETGYLCRLVGLIPQHYQGTTGTTVFFVGVPEGKQQAFGTETEKTRWVDIQEAHSLIQQTVNPIGRDRDQAVLCDLYRWLCARQKH
ncbi:NUDIX hydrolase [Hydrogenophaga defluvii]|uniref:NUDIX hydrolase n=1 Tax=Hydrogenophaga defluvii TaxID=249410 RepID=A0ABW2SCC6_9BURK